MCQKIQYYFLKEKTAKGNLSKSSNRSSPTDGSSAQLHIFTFSNWMDDTHFTKLGLSVPFKKVETF